MTISTGDQSRLLDVNDAFLNTMGYTAEEVIGRRLAELDLWEHPPEWRRLEQMLEKAGHIRNQEFSLRTKEGHILDCMISADVVTIHDQPCVLSVVQDMTERRRSEEELAAAIEAVMQDMTWFSRSVLEKLAALRQPPSRNKPAAELADLTPREREVLGLICSGCSDEDIVNELGLSRNTVRNHVAMIYSKVGVHRRGAAIVWARERGFTG